MFSSGAGSRDLSIVIPAFNEAARIGTTLDAICDFLGEAGIDGELLVVDDGSTDDTAVIARRILEIPTGDVVSAHFRFVDGSTGHIAAVSATPDYARFAVFGSHAWAEARETQHVDPGGTTHFYVRRRGDADQTRIDFEPASPVRAGYEHWADAVAGRADYRFSNAERLGNVAILEALVVSSESGRPEAASQYS